MALCISLGIKSESEFVESYVAFSANQGDVTEPTMESLQDFERKELSKARNKPVFNVSSRTSGYDTQFDAGDLDDDDDVMCEYIGKTTKVSSKSFSTTRQCFSFHAV